MEVETDPTRLWAPNWLLAGPCGDVWALELLRLVTDEESWLAYTVAAAHRYRNAREAWFHCHGLDFRRPDDRVPPSLTQGCSPWSFRQAVERGTLAGILARRELPADWTPTPAPRVVRELKSHGVPSADAVAVLVIPDGGVH